MNLEKTQIISIGINTGSYKDFISTLMEMGRKNISSYVCVANVHMLVEAHKDEKFANVVNSADLVTPDGTPLCHAHQLLYGTKQDRVAGMDLLPDLIQASEKERLPVYFYGGTDEMLTNTESFLLKKYPNLLIAGMCSPPFRTLTEEEEKQIIDNINQSGARFVFVALGCPKQEKWMARMKEKINACMIGIGGALPVMVGMQKRAPEWMQRSSLEWFFRLSQEPRRLFKRYLITNSKFCQLILVESLKKQIKHKSK